MPTYEDVFALELSVLFGEFKNVSEPIFLVKKVFLYHLHLVGRFVRLASRAYWYKLLIYGRRIQQWDYYYLATRVP